MNLYDIIYGKKYKKCKEDEIRNPYTRRCIKKDKEIAKRLLELGELPEIKMKYMKKLKKKEENKLKETISSKIFSYRINADIKKRIDNFNKIIKLLKIDISKKNYCLRLYNKDKIGKPIFKVGDTIILKKQIGSDSINGIVYLCNIKDKENKKYEFASKLVLNNKKTNNEIKIFNILNNSVLKDRCPHFPLLYGNIECIENEMNDISLYPNILKLNKNKSYRLILTELADGDLSNFINLEGINDDEYINALTQIYMSIMFFYKETKHFHNNAHYNNFLFHKITSGGYYHYNIFNEDYYIENIGYLWIIWDFDASISFEKSINKDIPIIRDFGKIIYSFLPARYRGWIKDKKYKISKKNLSKILKINDEIQYYYQNYSKIGMITLIKKILNILVKNGFLKKSIKNSEKIINSSIYKINVNNI